MRAGNTGVRGLESKVRERTWPRWNAKVGDYHEETSTYMLAIR